MSQLETILNCADCGGPLDAIGNCRRLCMTSRDDGNLSFMDKPDELREQIEAAKEDIATWQRTIDDNTSKIVDLALESMECSIDIERAKRELLRLSQKLVATSRTAVIQ